MVQHGNEIGMSQLLRFSGAVRRDANIEVWMREHADELGAIAQRWFEVMRNCGDDVREVLQGRRKNLATICGSVLSSSLLPPFASSGQVSRGPIHPQVRPRR